MTDLSSLAASLTEAQRRAILCARYGVIPSHYPTGIRISILTLKRLAKLGLTETWPPRLTETGLALRAYLKGQSDD